MVFGVTRFDPNRGERLRVAWSAGCPTAGGELDLSTHEAERAGFSTSNAGKG
jgi:hypothetical protein